MGKGDGRQLCGEIRQAKPREKLQRPTVPQPPSVTLRLEYLQAYQRTSIEGGGGVRDLGVDPLYEPQLQTLDARYPRHDALQVSNGVERDAVEDEAHDRGKLLQRHIERVSFCRREEEVRQPHRRKVRQQPRELLRHPVERGVVAFPRTDDEDADARMESRVPGEQGREAFGTLPPPRRAEHGDDAEDVELAPRCPRAARQRTRLERLQRPGAPELHEVFFGDEIDDPLPYQRWKRGACARCAPATGSWESLFVCEAEPVQHAAHVQERHGLRHRCRE